MLLSFVSGKLLCCCCYFCSRLFRGGRAAGAKACPLFSAGAANKQPTNIATAAATVLSCCCSMGMLGKKHFLQCGSRRNPSGLPRAILSLATICAGVSASSCCCRHQGCLEADGLFFYKTHRGKIPHCAKHVQVLCSRPQQEHLVRDCSPCCLTHETLLLQPLKASLSTQLQRQ